MHFIFSGSRRIGRFITSFICNNKMDCRLSSDYAKFQEIFNKARNVVALTGAGVSAESGVPTFRGAGGLWRTWQAQDLATPAAFQKNPSLVWEFYHYRREVMATKKPNPAHLVLAEAEKHFTAEGKNFVVITQNIDELHHRAGSKNVVELHGSLFRTLCNVCKQVLPNKDSPVCPALSGKGAPDPKAEDARIPVDQLPKCKNCNGLLRPHVIWFGEGLDYDILNRAEAELEKCDLCLVIGTSSVVYPAAMYAPQAAARGIPVAEFNIEPTPATYQFGFYFEGPCGETLPLALKI